MSSSVITIAFENWKAQEAASGKAVLLNEFVFANVPNLDQSKPIDRNEKLPPANQIVHRQAVSKSGLASENAVAYSVTLGADVGDFDFNWIGLLNKESNTVAMITHAPSQKKLKTQNGQQGNVLIRSFLLEFQGAAVETQIKTSAETWQIDFTARLAGIDEMQRLINVDSYGAAAFFDESFEVTRSGEQFTVKKGLGYVGGLRGELAQNQILNNLRNTKVYADFSYQGNIVSQWNTIVKITSAATLANYVDAAGFTHQVFAIASIDANGNVKDLRPMGGLSSQEIKALETRFKLDLSKKIDKANITHQTGNSTELVVSQQLLTTEVSKKQPAGNYQPAGDYASNAALNNGLALKFDKIGGTTTGNITVPSFTVRNPKVDLWLNFYPASSSEIGNYAYFQYGNSSGTGGRVGIPRTAGSEMFMLALSGDSYTKGESNNLFANKTVTQLQQFNSIVSSKRTIQAENNSLTFGLYIDPTKGAFLTGIGNDGNHYGELHHPMDGKIGTIARIEDFNTPVGMPIPWPQATAPASYLICNGQWFNKANYPLLAKAYPSGQLPDLRSEFIRGLDAGRNIDTGRGVLSTQGDAIRNITGEMSEANDRMINFSGAFYDGGFVGGSSGLSGGRAGHKVRFDASRAVPTANENRPRNIAFLYIVRAA